MPVPVVAMTLPHVEKYRLERHEGIYVGWAVFRSERKVFRAVVEFDGEVWRVRGVPFFGDGFVRLYEVPYSPWEDTRYVMFYPWDGVFGKRRFLVEFEVGVKRASKVVSYWGEDDVYGGVIVDGFLVVSRGEDVEVYDAGSRLLVRTRPFFVESVVGTPVGDLDRVLVG